ncbi:MAG: WG repeat-containing protein, partial [Spirochaetaceae bacterium]|nr:WG repeat-containing protein [Spirochaetaceae bacterium]
MKTFALRSGRPLISFRHGLGLALAGALVLGAAFSGAGCGTMPYEAPPDGVWDDLGEPGEGLAAALRGGRWGYVKLGGALAVLPQFAEALPFSEGRAAVRLTERWGYVDRAGKYLVKPRFAEARSYSDGLAAVKTGEGWGYLDLAGEFAVEPGYDEALPFSEGLAAVRLGSRWGYIRKDGSVAVRFALKAAGRFSG